MPRYFFKIKIGFKLGTKIPHCNIWHWWFWYILYYIIY